MNWLVLIFVVFAIVLATVVLWLTSKRERFRFHKRFGGKLTKFTLPFKTRLNNGGSKPLVGFVDMHTHLMANLGFGGHFIHGAPDVGSVMPAGTIYTTQHHKFWPDTHGSNKTDQVADSINVALGTCRATHGGWDPLANPSGNNIRKLIVSSVGANYHPLTRATSTGYPNFTEWPKHDDVTHQQMWIDWLRRAYDGGLRSIVVLVVNSVTMATSLRGTKPYDDITNSDRQITALKAYAGRHADWMEIAYTPEDFRRIIGNDDKMAIVIGVEYSDFGNFMFDKIVPTSSRVENEIQRLYDEGVRYIFPIHHTDNYFGGAAFFNDSVTISNKFQAGHWFDLECINPSSGITFSPTHASWLANLKRVGVNHAANLLALGIFDAQTYPKCPTGWGLSNKRRLQPLGKVALDKMMKLGMLIDIDHMSEKTISDVFAYTKTYPLMAGHSAIRSPSIDTETEFNKNLSEYEELKKRGGMAGLRFDYKTPADFINSALPIINAGLPFGMAADYGGTRDMPPPPSSPLVLYNSAFPRCTTGNKTWDFNTDGMAHVGLTPDYLRAIDATSGGNNVLRKLFEGVEQFARTWARCRIGMTTVRAGTGKG